MLIIFTSIFFLAFIGLLIYGLVAGEDVAFFISMICLGIMLIVGGFTLACTYDVIEASYIPEKIEMYETENARIEAATAEIVNSYLESLEGTYARVDAGTSVAVISAYPQLLSSPVVKQLDIYYENNQKIKELKDDLISIKATKWWLYFGG